MNFNQQHNDSKSIQLYYYDDALDAWVPASVNSPIPVSATFSGTITIGQVDQGSPNTLANGWPVKITDGLSVLGTLANPLHVTTDSTSSGTVTVVQPDGSQLHVVVDSSTTVVVQGQVHVLPDTSNVVVQNPVTVVQPVGSNLHAVLDTSNVNVVNFPALQHVTLDTSAVTVDLGSGINFPASLRGSVITGNTPYSMAVFGSYAYISCQTDNNIQVINISNPSSPVIITSLALTSSPNTLVRQGNYLYVLANNDYFIIDISYPDTPVITSSTVADESGMYATSVQGNYVYYLSQTTGKLYVYDISNPALPVLQNVGGTVVDSFPSGQPERSAISGNYLYYGNSSSGYFLIIDISVPSAPTVVSTTIVAENPSEVFIVGQYLYLSLNLGGMQIWNVSNPASPVLTGSVSLTSSSNHIFVQGNYAYLGSRPVSTFDGNISIIDISNPASPFIVNNIFTSISGAPTFSYAVGDFLYVVNLNIPNFQIYLIQNQLITVNILGDVPVGGKHSDNSTNSIAKLPVLPAIVSALDPIWTDGNIVPLTTDTSGNIRARITAPISILGDVTVIQPTGSNLHVVLDTSSVVVENFPVTQNTNLSEVGGIAVSGSLYDSSNTAIKVNVVAGGAGGGLSQIQVRDSSNVWTDVGFAPGDLNVPVQGTVTVVQPTGSNLHTVIDSGTLTGITNPVHVLPDTSAVTVSGAVTVIQPTGSNLHTVIDSSALVTVQGQVHVVLDTSSVVVSNFPASQHVTLDTSNVTVSGNVTVVQPPGSNLHVALDTSAVYPARANANPPSWSEGAQVPLSVDTSGNARIAQYAIPGGGAKPFHLLSAASTNPNNIKPIAGQVYGWFIYNNNNRLRKLVFHDTSNVPSAGSNIYFTLPIPPNSGANAFGVGVPFTYGIGITTVTGISDVDTSSVGLGDLSINIFYK